MTQTDQQNVPKLRFPGFDGKDFPDWEEKRLGSMGRFTGGGTPDTNIEEYWMGETPWISSSDLSEGLIRNLRITRWITQDAIKASATQVTPEGAILIVTRVGIGKCAIAPEDLCTSQDFTNFVPEQGVTAFFAYWLYYNQSKLQSLAQGTSIKGITTHDLKALKLRLPHPDEQRKIASFLGAVDTKIAQLARKKALLEDYKKGCMQRLFSQKIRFKDDNGNDFPDWEEKRLGEVATFAKGKGISKADIEQDGENLCIRYGELYTEYREYIPEVVSRTDTPFKGAVLSRKNDVLMPTSDVTPNGLATASAIDTEGVILGGDILIIRSNEILNRFFAYFVAANKPKIMRLVSGVTVYHIYGSDLATLHLAIPHPDEQRKIADFLSAIDRKIELVGQELEHAKTFKKGLLQQMFV